MEDQYLYQLVTESRTGAILRHLTVEAPLLKDHALPVQLPSRTPTMGRVEVEKMQSIRKTTNETQKAKRSKEMSLLASVYVQITPVKNRCQRTANGWLMAGDRL